MSNKLEDVEPVACECLEGRNLVVCIDGTSNQFSVKNSNVVELYSRLIKDKSQITYYNSGIGTYVKESESRLSWDAWKQSLRHNLDMAIASSFKEKVLSAYRWLSENYEKGDRIFLFGFSRGAYQVRVIAGMIERVGLLYKGNNEQIPFAYELYIKTTAKEIRSAELPEHVLCNRFKETLSHKPAVKIHFVGAWDTVSSVGLLREPSLPETTSGMEHVCIFRHALALDELRVKFLPEYCNGGKGPDPSNKGNVKEVWFAGCHSDIGGGNAPNIELDKFGPSLRWMSYEAISYGLKMESNQSHWSLTLTPTSSMSRFWRFMEHLPIHHMSYQGPNSNDVVWRSHNQRPRVIQENQLIHESVFETMRMGKYNPKAVFCDELMGCDWTRLDSVEKEEDPYATVGRILQKLTGYSVKTRLNKGDTNVLHSFLSTEIGRRSITEYPKALHLFLTAIRIEIAEWKRLLPNSNASHGSRRPSFIQSLVKVLDNVGSSFYATGALNALCSALEKPFPERQQIFLGRRFFALIIGIDSDVEGFEGHVAEAGDITDFLTTDLGIALDCIVTLRNQMATRTSIVKNIQNLARDPRIRHNDPILIYFSGVASKSNLHGYRDITLRDDEVYISTRDFNSLLEELYHSKGNNITVILDCPYSGDFGKGYELSAPKPYVLLAAGERAEGEHTRYPYRGFFTPILTTALRGLGSRITTTTYQDLVRLLKTEFRLDSPECMGKYDNHILFDIRPSHHSFYRIKETNGSFRLEAGEVHGVTNNAHFNVYSAPNANSTPTYCAIVNKVEAFFSTLGIYKDGIHEKGGSAFPAAAWALQLYPGEEASVYINISVEVLFHAVEKRIENETIRTIRLTRNEGDAELVLMDAGKKDKVVFKTTDKICSRYDLETLPYYLRSNNDLVCSILRHAAHFFWHLRRVPQTASRRSAVVKAWALSISNSDSDGRSTLVPTGHNLIHDGVILMKDIEKRIGFSIKNNTSSALHVWAFGFNMSDLSIVNIYKPTFPAGRAKACLQPLGELQIGYNVTLSGRSKSVAGSEGVTYLKFFISHKYVDLSHLEASSPFQVDEVNPTRVVPANADAGGPHILHHGGAPANPPPPGLWDTICIPIVKTRKTRNNSEPGPEIGIDPGRVQKPVKRGLN